jgi:hypothetical protein
MWASWEMSLSVAAAAVAEEEWGQQQQGKEALDGSISMSTSISMAVTVDLNHRQGSDYNVCLTATLIGREGVGHGGQR